jgi:Phosphatidate cytidylyltransferase, mitochondrial
MGVDADSINNNSTRNRVLLQSSDTLEQILYETFPPAHFDTKNIVYAFGYGSGVLSQQQQQQDSSAKNDNANNNNPWLAENKMIDVILVVQNVQLFHEDNIRHNAHHYNRTLLRCPSVTKMIGQTNDTTIQRQATICTQIQCYTLPTNPWLTNPGVYFHLVESSSDATSHTNHRQERYNIKYGIVQINDLIDDLQNWSFLYIAGRMHKPIVPIPLVQYHNDRKTISQNNLDAESSADMIHRMMMAQEQCNLPAAFATALLYHWYDQNQTQPLSESIDATAMYDIDLYQRIVGLSYSGDPRIGAFEDPKKGVNIVQSQYSNFMSLYRSTAQTFMEDGLLSVSSTIATTANKIVQTSNQSKFKLSYDWTNPHAHDRLWQCLPAQIRHRCGYNCNTTNNRSAHHANNNSSHDTDEVMLLRKKYIQNLMLVLSNHVVAPAARYQSIKGVCTTGLTKSFYYAYRKFTKGRYSASYN